jgi:hypothetical protein
VVLSRGRIVGRIDMAEIADIPTLGDRLAHYESLPESSASLPVGDSLPAFA